MAADLAIPTVHTLQECASWNKTVAPFIPQLYDLPERIWENIGSLEGLRQVYIETNPLIFGFGVSLVLAVVFFLAAEINRNYSQVDRAWSILPNLYVAHMVLWARMAGLPSQRLEFLVSATTIWSARLTFNYSRKGGYNIGSEDYRWSIIKSKVPAIVFFFFDLTFIATIQSILLLAFSAVPPYVILLTSKFEPTVQVADAVYCLIILTLVVLEYIADNQQWEYHVAKHQYQRDAKVPKDSGYTQAELDRGFLTKGLWAHSRHPNFAAEQLFWFVLYQWSCYAAQVMGYWGMAGSASLLMLFQGSTWLTELISAGKYPEYKYYQEQVSMFMPASSDGYTPPEPKVIRTSELEKRSNGKSKSKKAA